MSKLHNQCIFVTLAREQAVRTEVQTECRTVQYIKHSKLWTASKLLDTYFEVYWSFNLYIAYGYGWRGLSSRLQTST